MMILLGLLVSGAAALPDAAIGRWQTPTRHGVVEIAPCSHDGAPSICGRLVESDAIRTNPGQRDTKNRNEAQRERLLKGLTLLQGFKASGAAWTGGTIYNPDDGGTYQATVTLQNRDTLGVRGCIVWPLCKNQSWQRIKP